MATETLRPNAAGDETNISIQFPDSGAHWEKVDEEVADDDTTYVQENSVAWLRDLYNLPAHSASGTINFIKVYAVCKCNVPTVQTNLKIAIKTRGTAYESSEININTPSWTSFSNQWNTNPGDGAWTWDDIDALQIGITLRQPGAGRSAWCTQVYVEVDYTPPVGTNMKINISDVFKDIESLKINIGDAWKNVIKIQQNIGDVWKDVFG